MTLDGLDTLTQVRHVLPPTYLRCPGQYRQVKTGRADSRFITEAVHAFPRKHGLTPVRDYGTRARPPVGEASRARTFGRQTSKLTAGSPRDLGTCM